MFGTLIFTMFSRPDVACSRSRSTTDRSSRNCAAKNAASHSDTPCYPAGDITEEDGVETEPGCQVDTDSAPSDDFDDKEADDPLTECESEQDVEWAEEKKNSLLTECRRRIRYCCKRRMLKVRDAYMSGKAVCMIILFDVFVPSGIVWALGFLADQVAKTEQWGDEVYNISRNITEAQPTNWLVEKVKPAIDVGTESHELVGLVLGFLLAYQAQRAADSFMRAETDLQEMCACLKEGALACLPNFKQCKKSRGGAQIHWQFARSLSVLLLMAMRDLQVGSTEGVLEAQETWQTLLELGISAAEHNALKKAKPDMRVYLSLHWVRMLVDAAVAYKWLKQEPAKKARGSLDQFILKWKDARFVAYAEKPRMFQGLLSMLIYMFCFTLPFPLAAKLADYGKIVAVFVSLAFFAVKAAADQMSEPFGFDRCCRSLGASLRSEEGRRGLLLGVAAFAVAVVLLRGPLLDVLKVLLKVLEYFAKPLLFIMDVVPPPVLEAVSILTVGGIPESYVMLCMTSHDDDDDNDDADTVVDVDADDEEDDDDDDYDYGYDSERKWRREMGCKKVARAGSLVKMPRLVPGAVIKYFCIHLGLLSESRGVRPVLGHPGRDAERLPCAHAVSAMKRPGGELMGMPAAKAPQQPVGMCVKMLMSPKEGAAIIGPSGARATAKERFEQFYNGLSEVECSIRVDCQARYGNVPAVEALLPSIYFRCDGLAEAATFGKTSVVEYLLDNARNCSTTEPLVEAASEGQVKAVEVLLKHNDTTDYRNSAGSTPLTGAAQNGREETVSVLLGHKADPEMGDKYNLTALMWAAKNGHKEVFQVLLQSGATLENPWAIDASNNLPIYSQIEDKDIRKWWKSRMSNFSQVQMVFTNPRTYYAIIGGILSALFMVVVLHKLESYSKGVRAVQLVAQDQCEFGQGAWLLVAKAEKQDTRTGGTVLLLFRMLEAFANIVAVFGFGMVRIWWVQWLPVVTLAYLFPALHYLRHRSFFALLRKPALVIAAHNPGSALVALLRMTVLGGIVCFYSGTSPAMKQVNARLKSDWGGQMLLPDEAFTLPLPQVTMRKLIQISAPLAMVFVLAYMLALLMYIALSSAIEEVTDIEDEVRELLKEAQERERRKAAQDTKNGMCFCSSASRERVIFELPDHDKQVPGEMACNICGPLSCLYGKAFLYVLDVGLDLNTIYTLVASSNFIFAGVLTAIISRTFFHELMQGRSPASIRDSLYKSTERGIMHKDLLEMLNEEKSFEGALSLALTSFFFCTLTPVQAIVQAFSITLSAYGVAGGLYELIDLNLIEKSAPSMSQEMQTGFLCGADSDPEVSESEVVKIDEFEDLEN
ncbi:Kidins220 [Symbiodinium sp. KB8]|nr:Kidins220 [Symbiodinium sp. KB8]